jgi:23S rRNA pseudouridine1911/1915/1917 synthase
VKMAVRKGGKEAVTHYEVLRKYLGSDDKPVASMIECELETGRTHQIRVHLAKAGHPLLGDSVYGAGFQSKAALLPQKAQEALTALNRQALHAFRLAFSHPVTGKLLAFESKLPKELAALEKSFKKA